MTKYQITKSLDIQSGEDWFVAKEIFAGTVTTLFDTGTFVSAEECERRLRLKLGSTTEVVKEFEI